MILNRRRFTPPHAVSLTGLRQGPGFVAAFTLTEAIATLGGLGFQYHAAKHTRIAREQIIGTRTAQLLLEDWKSTDGSKNYDPSTLGLGFSSKLESSVTESAGTAAYSITVDNVPMQISLQWTDRPGNPDYDDPETGDKLRELSVTVRFNESENIPPVVLTTYVRIYAS